MRLTRLGGRGFALAAVALVAGAAPSAAAPLSPSAPVRVSGPSPFAPGCSGRPEPGTNYLNAEVEPFVSVDRSSASRIAGAWQQDRWSNGGAHGLVTGYSSNEGASWGTSFALFSRCPLGVAAGSPEVAGQPGSLFDRATDPWVSFGPTGVLHQISDSFNVTGRGFGDGSAILYSRSSDGGRTWSSLPLVLREDLKNTVLNDKETITADPNDARYVYAIWDRLVSPSENANPIATEHARGYRGPTWFARSTNGGQSFESARQILDPGEQNQTIGSQIVVGPDGSLINAFNLIYNHKNKKTAKDDQRLRGYNVAIQRSSATAKGSSWSSPILVDKLIDAPVVTPGDNEPVRTGDIIPDVAVDRSTGPRSGALYLVWQDGRFKADGSAAIALSRSTDGGTTWSDPIRVDQAGAAQAFTASVDVNDAGDIAVTYYDFSRDPAPGGPALTDYWITQSTDGGQTWSTAERVTPTSFDMKSAPNALGYFLGDYEGLDHRGNSFNLFYAAANTGDAANPTDIFFSATQ